MPKIFSFEIGDPYVPAPRPPRWTLKFNSKEIILITLVLFILFGALYLSEFKFKTNVPSDPEPLEVIRLMTHNAWSAYYKYAYSASRNGLKLHWDREKESGFERNMWRGETIVQSASTFWIMGLETPFNQTLEWINRESFYSRDRTLEDLEMKHTQFESIYLSSLLSCFALTHNQLFLERSIEVARQVASFYKLPKVAFEHELDPSELALSYRYLVNITSKSYFFSDLYTDRLKMFQDQLTIEPKLNSKWWADNLPPFYTYQIESFIQTAGRDTRSLETFLEAVNSAEKSDIFGKSKSGLLYTRYYRKSSSDNSSYLTSDSMHLIDCRYAAMFGLAAKVLESMESPRKEEQIAKFWKLAHNLVETCHQAAVKSPVGVPPERFYFNEHEDAENVKERILGQGKKFTLSGSLAETYFLLYRLTGSPKYREYAAELVHSLWTHFRTEENAFSELTLEGSTTSFTDYQPAVFLGATLKYLYLAFTDSSVLPISEWIFTESGQPLPVLN